MVVIQGSNCPNRDRDDADHKCNEQRRQKDRHGFFRNIERKVGERLIITATEPP